MLKILRSYRTSCTGVERKILATSGSLMTVEVTFQKGAIGAVHSHPHEQVSYIIKGSFEFEMDGQKAVISRGYLLCLSGC